MMMFGFNPFIFLYLVTSYLCIGSVNNLGTSTYPYEIAALLRGFPVIPTFVSKLILLNIRGEVISNIVVVVRLSIIMGTLIGLRKVLNKRIAAHTHFVPVYFLRLTPLIFEVLF